MAKPKYPKKLRQTLEKIRDARDEREGKDKDPFRTFAYTAAAAWPVEILHGVFDHDNLKIHQRFYWNPRRRKSPVSTVTTPPPWVQTDV